MEQKRIQMEAAAARNRKKKGKTMRKNEDTKTQAAAILTSLQNLATFKTISDKKNSPKAEKRQLFDSLTTLSKDDKQIVVSTVEVVPSPKRKASKEPEPTTPP